jgi:hypothetical protein
VSRTINALKRGELHRGVSAVNKDIQQLTAEISGAKSEPVIRGAQVLRKNWRRLISTAGKGEPSAPGSPPHAQKRHLAKSIGTGVVDGVRRVGSSRFTSRLQEFGYEARDGTQVEPRPHGRVALEQSAEEMVDVTVSEMQRKIAQPF